MDAATFKRATGCTLSIANKTADPMTAAMALYGIDTPLRICHFLARTGQESEGFLYTAEIWGPTAQQLKYDPPNDLAKSLGNTTKGDGEKYKGRGFIQVTGKFNYQNISKALGIDFVMSPELLESVSMACESAAWFWNEHGLNKYADADNAMAVGNAINRGNPNATSPPLGYDKQLVRLALAKGVLL